MEDTNPFVPPLLTEGHPRFDNGWCFLASDCPRSASGKLTDPSDFFWKHARAFFHFMLYYKKQLRQDFHKIQMKKPEWERPEVDFKLFRDFLITHQLRYEDAPKIRLRSYWGSEHSLYTDKKGGEERYTKEKKVKLPWYLDVDYLYGDKKPTLRWWEDNE